MIREATKQEIKNYKRVNALLTNEEVDTIFNLTNDEKIFDDLIHNKVNNTEIKAILKAHHISAKALSDWYFVG